MAPLAPLSEPSATRRAAFAALKAGLNASAGAVPSLTAEAVVPTGIPALDRILGGGFPRGALVALEGNAGRWSLAVRLVAQVTRRALAAIVDDGGLYPPGLVRAGVRLERVLIAPAGTALATARAADILVRSRACRVVLMSAPNLRAAVWTRLATLAHRAGVLLIAIAERAGAALSAAAALRLECTVERVVLHGTRGLWCTFAGYSVLMQVRKHQRAGGVPPAHARVRAATSLDGAVVRERAVTRERPAAFEKIVHAAVR